MTLNIAWFWVLGGMLIAYSVLDGFDLGVGATYLWVARSDQERRVSLNAIGPVWNGNEVWLLAAGGMLVVSFPKVYAAAFSGLYLALMLCLMRDSGCAALRWPCCSAWHLEMCCGVCR